ncbi:hypothetical protein IQ06DRAFT_110321 [Phaeosphaeriaceae sp. SRC1lsM3a]|nr:hypothetical protein IQ06DRAFT_110321 [Stagonospora sp. SRC1lsM3a]
MLRPSTVSARCAALGTSIAQVIPDIGQFARRVRDARHDLNAINNDLLIIRTGLGIAQDDFSNSQSTFPDALLNATSQILDSCDVTSERLHKIFLKLSCSVLPQDDWKACKDGPLASMRQDLEGSRMVLELSLDYLALYVQIPGQETTIDSFQGGYTSDFHTATDELLKKTDIDEIQVNHIARERLPSLLQAIRLLRSCITAVARKKPPGVRTTTPRPDSLEPSLGETPRSLTPTSAVGTASTSGSKGIGTWLAGIPRLEDAQPLRHSRIVEMTKPRPSRRSKSKSSIREEVSPSRGTFLADENVPANALLSPKGRLKKTRSWASGITAQYATHSSSTTKVPSKYTPSIASSNVSIIHKKLTCDKIAVAKDNRKNLDVSSRVGVDRILANLPAEATATEVERILFSGANPMVHHEDYGFFFIRAAYEMSHKVLEVLIAFGADTTKTVPPPNRYHCAMHAAAMGGRLDTVKYLAAMGHSIDIANEAGETPLVSAIKAPGAYQAAKWLLDMGSDVNHETKDGETPLYLALTSKVLEGRERSRMVELLHSYGAASDVSRDLECKRGDAKGRSILGIT